MRVEICWSKMFIRTRNHRNCILSLHIGVNQRDPRRSRNYIDSAGIYLRFLQTFPQLLAKSVSSDLPEHADRGTEASGRYRLVRTLTARECLEGQSSNRFTRSGDSLCGSDQVKINTSHYYDLLSHVDS